MSFPRPNFQPFAQKMTAEGLPEVVIKTFAHYYQLLTAGETGLIAENSIEPVRSLPDAEQLPAGLSDIGTNHLPQTVLIKLNGGLGTGMGLAKAKSLLVVKENLTFLDIIARQAHSMNIPLLLMNSYNTQADSLAVLSAYPGLNGPFPLDFLQHKVPKIVAADLSLAAYPADPSLEWCPPGHGDIYTALVTSGMLDQLLAAGIYYAFVSNADNLGAVLDPAILGYFVQQQLPFMMEVADRTEADKKGGHLAQSPSGQLLLRESAQCPPADEAAFQDIDRHKYFNTNNLWLNLVALKQLLSSKGNVLGLPMIRNRKPVNPRDPHSTPVYQLETAMGSAIAIFAGAGAMRVPRHRFAPVKKNNDLLVVRSDAYLLTEDYRIIPNPARPHGRPAVVELDAQFYDRIDDLEARFPHGTPSLLHCERLVVKGNVYFSSHIQLSGRVHIHNPRPEPLYIAQGQALKNCELLIVDYEL